MNTLTFRFIFAVFLTLALTIIPLPEALAVFRPPWVLMFVLYVQFFLPRYFRITWVFLLGLSMDVLLASVIGEHAFALLLASIFASSKTRRFHFFSIAQQMILIALFCSVYQFILVLIDAALGYNNEALFALGTVLITMTFWPWVKLLADSTLLPEVKDSVIHFTC